MGRKASDRVLRRWLETGKPGWVDDAAASDPAIAQRLEAMSALSTDGRGALERLVEPRPDFEARVTAGVRSRIDNYGTASLLAEMVGLGFHVGRALFPPGDEDEGRDRTPDSEH